MVFKCIIRSCYVYSSDKTYSMFRLPSVYKRFTESERKLAEMRLEIWVKACGLNKTPAPHHRICGRHFVSGRPAKLSESNDVDWAPTMNLQDTADDFLTKPMESESGLTVNCSTNSIEERAVNLIVPENQPERNVDLELPVNQQDSGDALMSGGNADVAGLNQTSHFESGAEFETNQELSFQSVESSWICAASNDTSGGAYIPSIDLRSVSPSSSSFMDQSGVYAASIAVAKTNEIGSFPIENQFSLDDITCISSQQSSTTGSDNLTVVQLNGNETGRFNVVSKAVYYSDVCVQTETCMEKEVAQWKAALERSEKQVVSLLDQHEKLQRNFKGAQEATQLSISTLETNDKKCRYFTGLSCGRTLKRLYEALQSDIPEFEGLDKEKTLILTLRKLRLNEPFCTLGYLYNLNQTAISKYFYETVNAIYPFMKALVRFPSRNVLKQHMPLAFRKKYNDAVTVIIDCFEINIESPNSRAMVASANVFSNYKKHNTIKVLIGVSASGNILYVSEAFGGRASDKEIVKSSGFLNHLQEGDFVMADRGFLIDDLLVPLNATVAYPAFKKKNQQLEPLDAVDSKELSSLRIHVERVIGVLRQKFLILMDTIPITMLQHWNNDTPAIDQILAIAAGLVNLCPSVVSSS